MSQWCVDHPSMVLGTIGVFRRSRFRLGHVQHNSSRMSERPNCSCNCACAEVRRSTSRKIRSDPETLVEGRPAIFSTYTAYVGQGSPRFCRPQSATAERGLCRIVIVAKDVESRERIKAEIEKAVPTARSRGRASVDPLQFGPRWGFGSSSA